MLKKKEKNGLVQRSPRRASIIPAAILGIFYWEKEEAAEWSLNPLIQEASPEDRDLMEPE